MNTEPATLGISSIADSIALSSDAWTVVIVQHDQIEAASFDLRAELTEVLAEDESVYRVEAGAADSTIESMRAHARRDVALITGIEELGARAIETLDARRDALQSIRLAILCTDLGASLLRKHAPNWWSWIGGRCYRLSDSEGTMDTERRLASLREAYGFSDAELVRRVTAGELEIDSVITEWLILSGQADQLEP